MNISIKKHFHCFIGVEARLGERFFMLTGAVAKEYVNFRYSRIFDLCRVLSVNNIYIYI